MANLALCKFAEAFQDSAQVALHDEKNRHFFTLICI